MSHAFADIAFTPAVRAAQARDGSRAQYARAFESGEEVRNAELGPEETAFIQAQRSFYMATVSETGWPYVQHRGGAPGFLTVRDARTLSFVDVPGNRQFISMGNLSVDDRVALILVDYAHRQRMKLLGRLSLREVPGPGRPVREMVIRVEAFDWNCPQHIPVRFEAEDVQRALDQRDRRIARLEAELERPRASLLLDPAQLPEISMATQRVFRVSDHLQPNDGEPVRSVVHATDEAAVVAWTVRPGQRLSAHVHPSGQDTWTVLEGEGNYQLDAAGQVQRIRAGDVVVAPKGAVHGVIGIGARPLVILSVVSPALSGHEPV